MDHHRTGSRRNVNECHDVPDAQSGTYAKFYDTRHTVVFCHNAWCYENSWSNNTCYSRLGESKRMGLCRICFYLYWSGMDAHRNGHTLDSTPRVSGVVSSLLFISVETFQSESE